MNFRVLTHIPIRPIGERDADNLVPLEEQGLNSNKFVDNIPLILNMRFDSLSIYSVVSFQSRVVIPSFNFHSFRQVAAGKQEW